MLGVGLDYGEEVHRSVINFQPKTRLFEAMVGTMDKLEKESVKLGVLRRYGFMLEGLRFPKKLDLQRTPLVNNVVMFSSMLEVIHKRSLGHTVNPSQ